MSHGPLEARVAVLRWVVGLVVLLESIHFTIAAAGGHHLPKVSLPHWFWIALGATEAVAALLFLAGATRTIGGYALLVVFALAGLIHILHGELDIGGLVVYAAAVIVSIAPEQTAGPGERA